MLFAFIGALTISPLIPRAQATPSRPDPTTTAPTSAPAASEAALRVRLKEAIEAYQHSDFAAAEGHLVAILTTLGGAKGRTAEEAHTYHAFVQAAFGHGERAIEAFERALAINPELKLDNPSPKIAHLFEQAQRRRHEKLRALDHDPPRLSHQQPKAPLRYGHAAKIIVMARDISPVKEVTLHYRIAGHRGFAGLTMEQDGPRRYVASIPTVTIVRPGVEYFIEAWDVLGNGPGLKGSSRAPIRLTVVGGPLARNRTSAPRPWYKKWWIWAIAAGTVATAAGVSVGAYLGRSQHARITVDGLGSLP
ncbi:MAG: hypothetical protein KAI47_16735 [Deltaproteobacteria bacterium]|nr:hypothetical protein [Deltaproteobacteria bacterium]